MDKNSPAHPSPETLRDFDSGQLPSREWAAVEGHVAECGACCKVLETIADDALTSKMRATGKRSPATPSDVGVQVDTRESMPKLLAGPAGNEWPAELDSHPRYRVLGFVGAGGMGVVFRAEHRLMERVVALKILNKDLTSRPEAVERFRLEVKAAARLSHPNIVTAHDADHAGEIHFLVTEFVEGQDLDRWISQNGRASIAQACDWVRQAAEGLQHAHERHMVHRDVKPSNLLLTLGGQVKILDFGLARLMSERTPGMTLPPSTVVIGTPDYVAPEQARNPALADARADVYSLGCTLYFLLAGRTPFPKGTMLEKLIAHQELTPPEIRSIRPDVPTGVVAVLERMMAKDPVHRYQEPAEVAQALAPWALQPSPTPSTKASPRRRTMPFVVAASLFLVIGGATLATLWLTGRPREERVQEEKRNPPAPVAVAETGGTPAAPVVTPSPRPAVTPAPPPAVTPAPPPVVTPARPSVVTPPPLPIHPIVDWVVKNNRQRADHPVIFDLIKKTEKKGPDAGFTCFLGADLVKSRRPTVLTTLRGFFFVLELSPEQMPGFPGTGIFTYDVVPQAGEKVSPQLQFQLGEPVVQGAEAFDPDGNFSGQVRYKRLRAETGFLAVRVRYIPDDRWRTSACMVPNKPREKEGTFSFDLRPLALGARRAGALIVIVDVCQYPTKDFGPPTVVSNPVLKVLNLTPPPAPKPGP